MSLDHREYFLPLHLEILTGLDGIRKNPTSRIGWHLQCAAIHDLLDLKTKEVLPSACNHGDPHFHTRGSTSTQDTPTALYLDYCTIGAHAPF